MARIQILRVPPAATGRYLAAVKTLGRLLCSHARKDIHKCEMSIEAIVRWETTRKRVGRPVGMSLGDLGFGFAASSDVEVARDGEVLTLTIRREPRRNALSLGVLNQIREVMTEAASQPALKVAVITGAGERAFAAGGDLDELDAVRSVAQSAALSDFGRAALDAIRRFPLPVVARLNGLALGGGAELALACDFRFAVSTASLGLIHARLAITPSWGGGSDLMRLLGPSKALSVLAHAQAFSAAEALQLGLIDAVSEPDGFDAMVRTRLERLLERPTHVLRAIKAVAIAERFAGRGGVEAAETAAFTNTWPHPEHWACVEAATRSGRG